MPRTRKEYTEANRIAWDEAASRHAAHNNAELFNAVAAVDYVSFEGEILATLQRVGVDGKHVIQLGCNNARETLSLRNMGAARCVGVDASAEFLAHGHELIGIAAAEDQVELVEADLYNLPARFNGAFDMVLVCVSSTENLRHGTECSTAIASGRMLADGLMESLRPVGTPSRDALRCILMTQEGKIPADRILGTYFVGGSRWFSTSKALFMDTGNMNQDYEGMT